MTEFDKFETNLNDCLQDRFVMGKKGCTGTSTGIDMAYREKYLSLF